MDHELLNGLIGQASEKVLYWGWNSFSISTQIPKEWFIREEAEWDKKFDRKSQSIKSRINATIIKGMLSATKKNYNPLNSDGKIVFDLSANKITVDFEPIFIFGRYKKLESGLSQSRWVCPKCEGDGCFKCDWKGKYYISVEELVGERFKEQTDAQNYSMHASGREDVDVINTAGRPFVLELIKPKKKKLDLEALEKEVNSGKQVAISDLKIVSRGFVEVVTESHFEKEYEADVEFSESLDEERIAKLLAFTGKTIVQRTPKRVAHRRADLKRQRKIISLILVKAEGNKATFRIVAEAGTYIKELINGDNGRTEHSFSSTLSCVAKCSRLQVVRIYDEFLDLVLS